MKAKTFKFKWKELNKQYDLCFETSKYMNNNRLYVGVLCYNKEYKDYECFTDLTINIPSYMFETDTEIILNNDTNRELIDLLLDMGVITDTCKYAYSGFGTYKVVEFNMEKAKEYMLESGE